jgi:adenosylhomocysteine nucleosidase
VAKVAPRLLFISGLQREAAIARGPDALAICGDAATLRRELAGISAPASLVISFGLCGGLDPALRSGDIVIGTRVMAGEVRLAADQGIARDLAARLSAAGERVSPGAVAGVGAPVLTRAAKGLLRQATMAAAVDMESLIAARFAADRGAPFAVVRIVSDSADRDLPPLVMKATRPDGGIDLGAVIAGMIRSPAQISGLIAAARDSAAAFAALRRCRRLPGLFLSLGLTNL